MKRNFNQELTTFSGEKMKSVDGSTATAKSVIIDALLADDRQLSGTDKMKHFALAEKIHKSDDSVELSTEDLTIIKGAVGKIFAPMVVGQVYRIIEEIE